MRPIRFDVCRKVNEDLKYVVFEEIDFITSSEVFWYTEEEFDVLDNDLDAQGPRRDELMMAACEHFE